MGQGLSETPFEIDLLKFVVLLLPLPIPSQRYADPPTFSPTLPHKSLRAHRVEHSLLPRPPESPGVQHAVGDLLSVDWVPRGRQREIRGIPRRQSEELRARTAGVYVL